MTPLAARRSGGLFPKSSRARQAVRLCPTIAWGSDRSDPYAGTLAFTFISDEARTAVPELMSQLGIPKFIACGHSVGGAMAIEVAAALPASTSAVITIAA